MLSGRATKLFLLAVVITIMVVAAFGAGIGATWLLMHDRTARAEESAEFVVFWEAWHLVEDRFFGDLPDMQRVAWGAIRGALATLDDPYTTFLEPQPRQREKENLSGRFGGIGAYVTQAEDGSIVLDPMPDLPAEQAGVQKGDVLVRVDDTEITPEMTVDDVVTIVRGEVGTIVRLSLRREGEPELVVVEVERQEIPTPSVEWRMLEEADGVGYVRLMIFGGRKDAELVDALEELSDLGMTSLILDLRGNGGGFLDAAVDVASEFLAGGVVLHQVEKDKPDREFTASRSGRYVEAPLVLLVIGQAINALSGPVGYLLLMTGHQMVAARIITACALLKVVLNIALIPAYGAAGAAAASAVMLIALNGALYVVVRRRLDLDPTLFAFLRRPPTADGP